jgi:putative addiction module antidote
MISVKVTTVGNSAGVVLPKEALARLKIKKGDTLYLIETRDGYMLTGYDPEFAAQMDAAEEGMRTYRNALRELAR